MDPRTGEIRKRRTDAGAGHFTEGGGDRVYGSKFAIITVRAMPDLPYGLSLSARPVDGSSPSKEADKVVAQVKSVCDRVARTGVLPSLVGPVLPKVRLAAR